MALEPIVIGENALITRNLKQANGTDELLIADIISMTVELIQDDLVKKTWTFEQNDDGESDDEWSTGFRQSDVSQVQIELLVATSATLEAGTASLRWIISAVNPEMFVSGQQTSITDEDVFEVVESDDDIES